MTERFIVFDQDGIIHESNSFEDAHKEFLDTDEFKGDMIFCQEIMRRR